MPPALKVQSGGELWKWLMPCGKHFLGVLLCHQDGHLCSCVDGSCCPCCRVGFLPSDGGSSCLLSHVTPEQLPLKRQSLVTFLELESSYQRKKALFSGERTTVESFKSLNNDACSRSVSLAAECSGESSTESHLFVILSKPE